MTIPLLLGALVLASCKQAEEPKVAEEGAGKVILVEAQLPPKPVKPPLPPLFSDIERRTFQFSGTPPTNSMDWRRIGFRRGHSPALRRWDLRSPRIRSALKTDGSVAIRRSTAP
ncbi:hypothetical protein FDU21_00095 [Xanthomonas oryzae pv. oryzae]|nr:hypothetical protein FDU21_00095 [Xanthomonas oryzae pv. oryzae]